MLRVREGVAEELAPPRTSSTFTLRLGGRRWCHGSPTHAMVLRGPYRRATSDPVATVGPWAGWLQR